jgi:N-glycosylase/DNA lyase
MNAVELIKAYSLRKKDIKKRLKEFRSVSAKGSDDDIFAELCFCICTPQSRAVHCDKAVKAMIDKGCLLSGGVERVRSCLKAVRFPNNKARFIYEARRFFTDKGRISIKEHIDPADIPATRMWFFKNVKGLGLKEASHFLRNIGFGEELAILDVHILRRMKELSLINEFPKTLTPKKYFEYESALKKFADKTGIPVGDIDLLFWSMATGYIFK